MLTRLLLWLIGHRCRCPAPVAAPIVALEFRSPLRLRRFTGVVETDQGIVTLPPNVLEIMTVVGDRVVIQWNICMTATGTVILPEHGGQDNALEELLDLARKGDRLGFGAVASCLMPTGEVDECWRGTRARLGLSS